MTEGDVYITARVPGKLREILRAHVLRDTHMSESEFVREAVREKLQHEAGDLYESLVRGRADRSEPTGQPSAHGNQSSRVSRFSWKARSIRPMNQIMSLSHRLTVGVLVIHRYFIFLAFPQRLSV